MNSYPIELLTQLAPVMFVAGLDVPNPPPETPQTPRQHDPFIQLNQRLRDALVLQRKSAIWNSDKSKTFQVILVDKDVRFPPRKLVAPEDPGYSAAHSPLSPLTPSSPLHPDGLIAPIWVRKHTTLIPSVFVLFTRLYEPPVHQLRSPLDLPDPERDKEREQEERRHDSELSAEIALRKRSTNERGMKLTVVLLASRKMLDDSSLDTRLTFIRRSSGLDSRAALFVLSPVSQAELGEFIQSLQQALYDPALEYYTSHSKRVRRKRNRHAQSVASYPTPLAPLGNGNSARPLRPEGWTVRYEYKMACFAEFRGEDEVALKHYQDAYEALVIMFGSIIILPPRTKRWAEAKVLVDCINIKITKLYLYNNEHSLALSHHMTHMRRFGDFSRGWGIGEDTFEYWSWMARQHRVLAELIEQGTHSTLVIPVHKPIVSASSINSVPGGIPRMASPGMEVDAIRSLGVNPNHALQHPGFYYYMAARCTESRREKFITALEGEKQSDVSPVSSPGFANEKKVDHFVLILELYTKSYELFKKHAESNPQAQQGRLPLYIAYRIAQTYHDSARYDMAIRFFERIAKTYRREQWGSLLGPLLSTWYRCAVNLGDLGLSIRLLIEMIDHGANTSADSSSIEVDLLRTLKDNSPPSDEPIIIDDSESQSLFDSSLVFWKPEVKVNERAAFQLSLVAPADTSIETLPFSQLEIYVEKDSSPIVVGHSDSVSYDGTIQRVDLGCIDESREHGASLRWKPGGILILTGTVSSSLPGSLTISHLKLRMAHGSWMVDIPLKSCKSRYDSRVLAPRWLSSVNPIRFIPVDRENYSSARCPFLTTELDGALNTIAIGDEQSSSLIKGISLGTLSPGASTHKEILLHSTGLAGDRTLDISVQSRRPDAIDDADVENQPELLDLTETLETITVPTVHALKLTSDVTYRRATHPQVGLADLRTYDNDYWEDGDGGEAEIRSIFRCDGPWPLRIESVVFKKQDGPEAKLLASSLEEIGEEIFPSDYSEGDHLGDTCTISIAPRFEDIHTLSLSPIPVPGGYEVSWRRILSDGSYGPRGVSDFVLPPLQPPVDGLIALVDVSPSGRLHQPQVMSLTVRNRHPTRSANITVHLDPDPTDGFIVSGLRNGRVPVLLPGGEEKVVWKLIPVECGHVRLPKIRVVDRRKAIATAQGLGGPNAEIELEGTPVKVVDLRTEQKVLNIDPTGDAKVVDAGSEDEPIATVLVLP